MLVSCQLNQLKEKFLKFGKHRFDRDKYPKINKTDIINYLGKINSYSTYLEIATETTGFKYAYVSESIFPEKKRILYNTKDDYSDGQPAHYISTELTGEKCLRTIIDSSQTFDVVFVDPYHSYDASLINLQLGYQLVKPDGIMVVHDCNPPDEHLTSPESRGGAWCGLTYQAFIDFVRKRPELEYCVVDTDYGVGLVFRTAGNLPKLYSRLPERSNVADSNFRDWKVFSSCRKEFLRLISVNQFKKIFVAH